MTSFIQYRKDKIEGLFAYVNLSTIVSFEKDVKLVPDEQWYHIVTINGQHYYTLYNLLDLNIYNLPT